MDDGTGAVIHSFYRIDFLETYCGVIPAKTKHLLGIVLAVGEFHVGDITLVVINGFVLRIDKATIGRDAEFGEPLKHFLVELGVNLHGISVDEVGSSLVVAFALDALYLAEELSEKVAEFLIVVDFYEGFSVFLHEFNHFPFLTFFKHPCGD